MKRGRRRGTELAIATRVLSTLWKGESVSGRLRLEDIMTYITQVNNGTVLSDASFSRFPGVKWVQTYKYSLLGEPGLEDTQSS